MPRDLQIATGAIVILALLLFSGTQTGGIPLESDPFAVYQKHREPEAAVPFHFDNRSALIGTGDHFNRTKLTLFVTTGDFNRDGFDDVAITYAENLQPPKIKLLKNEDGKRFVDVSLNEFKSPSRETAYSAAAFVDLDNDGWEDLYIAQFMKPHLALKNVGGNFSLKNQIPIDEIIQPTRGINLMDFDNDGFVDILLTSFSKDLYSFLFNQKGLLKARYPIRDKSGSQNVLLKNMNGSRLQQTLDALGLSDGGFTWATGIADFNDDGFPDVYVANDFGFDHLYQNVEGRRFADISKESLGPIRSENSMGAEIGDVLNNGRLHVYVTNASKPGMPKGWNRLWQQTSGATFEFADIADQSEIDKCGFAWGSKFSDLDKDGQLDLFVVNGRSGRQGNNNNRWFYRLYEWNMPPELKYLKFLQVPPFDEYDFAQGQRSCVFWQKNGNFVDVAEQAGVKDLENGRALAMLDYNNDGQEDFIVGSSQNDPILYAGSRTNQNHWLGLKLTGRRSNRNAIGAKVKVTTQKGTQTRIVSSGNGYANVSTRRMLFGFQEHDTIRKIEIIWPSKKVQTFTPSEADRYYEIFEEI